MEETMTTIVVFPLAQAGDAHADAAAKEMAAQMAYQTQKRLQQRSLAQVRHLLLQETRARSLPEAVAARAERRVLEAAQQACEAELARLDRTRREANTVLLAARVQYSALQDQASTHWRALRQAQSERQEASSARETLDAQEHLHAAVDALAQVVGADEAERCAQSTDTPSWVRG
jgi:hypothetical protein